VRDETVGVYVHVPFCERVCPYCDFPVVAARTLAPRDEDDYVRALLAELAQRRADFAGLALASVYLGGGTPSLLRPESVARVIAAVREAFRPEGEPEVTLEVNPSTLERERLPGFRAAGASRLSIGIQSFDDGVLKRLGRAHRAEEGHATLRAARAAGFENVSLDLIFAAPGQTREMAEADADEAAAFEPEHVSAYALTVEAGTPYAGAVARGRLALPAEDEAAAMMEAVPERLARARLVAYEISNLARPGFESAHNRRYWARLPVLGLGMGAWSTEPRSSAAPHGARRANRRDLAGYLERALAGESAAVGPPEVLDARTARGEAAFLALRTARGLRAAEFAAEFGAPPRGFFGEAIERFRRLGLLEEAAGGDLRLSPRGRLLADGVCEAFV
jgi:oxygen-independent coproporphyrinogen-3 oxidase